MPDIVTSSNNQVVFVKNPRLFAPFPTVRMNQLSSKYIIIYAFKTISVVLYSKTKNNDADTSKASYVTNMKGSKGVLADDMTARVSQMEHALSQTPSMEKFEAPNKEVRSEDEAIMKKMSGLHLKSFAKNINLKETSRQQLANDENKTVTEPLREGPLVKLKNSGLMMNRRNIGGHGFSISDLVRTGK